MNADDADVLFRAERGLGWITLNRPQAINALTHAMFLRIDAQLALWAADDRIGGVVLAGAGERGLCAGGDIVSIYRDAQAGGRASVDLCVTLRALRQAARLTLLQVLEQDLRIVNAAFGSHDLAEGIRAQLIDKDRTPHWSPATLADVTPDLVDRYFAPPPDGVRPVPGRP